MPAARTQRRPPSRYDFFLMWWWYWIAAKLQFLVVDFCIYRSRRLEHSFRFWTEKAQRWNDRAKRTVERMKGD